MKTIKPEDWPPPNVKVIKNSDIFIQEYLQLVKKYNMYITNCGCCSDVGWVKDCDKETIKYIKKELGYIDPPLLQKVKKIDNKNKKCKTCLKGTYREIKQSDAVLCDKCNANHPRYEITY